MIKKNLPTYDREELEEVLSPLKEREIKKLEQKIQKPSSKQIIKLKEVHDNLKSRYSFKDGQERNVDMKYLEHYQQSSFLFQSNIPGLCKKWVIVLNWLIAKKLWEHFPEEVSEF